MVIINWTNESKYWLNHIYEYIAKNNPYAAKKVINGIYDQVELLKTFSEIGYKVNSLSNRNVRIILYGHYRIAYLIKNENAIDILAILHGKMDIRAYFKKNV